MTEDLLNVSEAARIELKKLLTKKRLERKTVAVHQKSDESALQVAETVDMQQLADIDDDLIDAASLPEATYEISTEDKEGVPKGSLIVSDPVICVQETWSCIAQVRVLGVYISETNIAENKADEVE